MLKKFKQHIHQNFPFLENEKLLIAISGGIDSVVLAHLCYQLKLDFSLCHCNFKLRGEESDDDETFVDTMTFDLNFTNELMGYIDMKYIKDGSK